MIHSDDKERPPPLAIAELNIVLNNALLRRTFNFSRNHATSRSRERHLTFEDVVQTCRTGTLEGDPRYKHQQWSYKVVGKNLNGEATTVIIAVDREQCWVTIITLY